MPRVLIVEDDAKIVEVVKSSLGNAGFEVESVADGEAGLNALTNAKYDLVVLDVVLPKLQGFDVCRQLRARQNLVPILFLSGQTDPIDRTLGLELGADDYLTKPFAPQELIARVRAILRRYGAPHNPGQAEVEDVIGEIRINYDRFSVTRRGEPIPLTATEFRLLACLADNRGRTLTRDDLRELVWGTAEPGEQTVTSTINRLRNKLEDDPNNPVYVLTVRGFGYRLFNQ